MYMNFPRRNIITNIKVYDLTLIVPQKKCRYKNYIDSNSFLRTLFPCKPRGLWYSCYDSWYKFLQRENFSERFYKYVQKVNFKRGVTISINEKPNPLKVLLIKNNKDLVLFTERYGFIDKDYKKEFLKFDYDKYYKSLKHFATRINWHQVSKHYAGIEICPLLLACLDDYFWYSLFDVASGCVWNLPAVVSSIKIAGIRKGKNSYVSV